MIKDTYPQEVIEKFCDCELELQEFKIITAYKWGYILLLDNNKIVIITNDMLRRKL